MEDLNVRRLYISDEEWNRTSASWKELRPLRNFNEIKADDETVEACYKRLQQVGYEIPLPVIEQWIYPHYYNARSAANYGWIDYRNAAFLEVALSVEEIKQLYVIEAYRDYVEVRSTAKPFEDFMCIARDVEHWKTQCTWRIPPVVLDVRTLSNIPSYAELGGVLQLIEGHSRLGYLYAMENEGILHLRKHKVFLLSGS